MLTKKKSGDGTEVVQAVNCDVYIAGLKFNIYKNRLSNIRS